MDSLSVHKEHKGSSHILRPRAVRQTDHSRPSTQTREGLDNPNGYTDVPASAPSRHATLLGGLEHTR